MTVLCLVIGGAIIIGERCRDAHDRWVAITAGERS